MSHGGKGDTPRPFSVDAKTFESNWDAIFGKKKKVESQEEKDIDPDYPDGKPSDSTQGG
jgi:hypothetical protein